MTLSFLLQLNGKPTYFPEKILLSPPLRDLEVGKTISDFLFSKYYNGFNKVINSKLHTIRSDKSNRWKAGNDIHFVINNRTKNRMQFAPVVKCVNVQEIEILPEGRLILLPATDSGAFLLNEEAVERLAINDGFDSVEDFWAYFNKPFEGVIIHWTDLTY